jgi:LysM repeat protein
MMSLATLIAIPSILPSSAIASVMKKLPKSEVTMTNPNFQKELANINTMRLGDYSMTNAINIISWTLYGEAGSQGKNGKEAVASVILNMAGGDPTKFVDIIFTPSKFSIWNPDDKFAKLHNLKKAIDRDYQYKVPSNTVRIVSEKKSWDDAVEIATRMALGNFKSTIGKRNAYLNIELTKKTNPKSDALGPNGWSTKMTDKLKIKDHTFGYLPENDGYLLNRIPKGDPNATTYKVQRGDSLWKIARMFNTSSKKLALLNGISKKTPLRIG